MASFNQISICGYLGRDVESRFTPQGLQVANFSVATSDRRKNASGEYEEETLWFRVTVWGKQAEVASKFLQKGSFIYVTGALRMNEYTDREGEKRHSLEVNAMSFHMLGPKGESANVSGNVSRDDARQAVHAAAAAAQAPSKRAEDDDIPF